MFTMLVTIILATLFMASSSARPLFNSEERDQTLSPCFLNCTNIALSAVGCNGLDLHCLCNSAAFRNVLTSCVHQMCPDQDSQTADFQEQECANVSTLSATELISGSSPTSTPTQPTQASAASSSPAPLSTTTGATSSNPGVVSSDTFAHFGDNSSNATQNTSDHTGIIIGSVIGAVVLMMIIFFLYWWRRRSRTDSDRRLVRRSNRMSFVGGSGIGHSYQGDEATARPWSYPIPSSSSGRAPRPFILSTTPLTKPQSSNQQSHNNHGYRELRNPDDQATSEHSGTSASSPRRLTSSSGQRLSMPPPAYQPSSASAKYGSWKQ